MREAIICCFLELPPSPGGRLCLMRAAGVVAADETGAVGRDLFLLAAFLCACNHHCFFRFGLFFPSNFLWGGGKGTQLLQYRAGGRRACFLLAQGQGGSSPSSLSLNTEQQAKQTDPSPTVVLPSSRKRKFPALCVAIISFLFL